MYSPMVRVAPKRRRRRVFSSMDRLPQSEIIVVHSGGGAEKDPAALGKLELLPLAAEQLGAVLFLQSVDVL